MPRIVIVTVSKPALTALIVTLCLIVWSRHSMAQQPGGLLATDLVAYSRTGTCPTGWTEDASLRGLYLVGLPTSGTNLGTVGTALSNVENRAVGQHGHVQDPHGHGVTDPGHQHMQRYNTKDLNTLDSLTNGFNDGSVFDGALTALATTGLIVNNVTAVNQNAGSVIGTNAPYIQYVACKKL